MSRGRRSSSGRRIPVSTTDRPHTHTAILRRLEKFRGIMLIVIGGIPVKAVTMGADLERALQYGNRRSVTEHLPAV